MQINILGKQISIQEISLLLAAIVFFLMAGFIHNRTTMPEIQISKQESALNLNHNLLVFFSAGNKRLLSDIIWIQTLIESDLEHYQKRDLNSWLFLRFLSIQKLDPLFYQNYLYGGQFLSIIKDDLEGAEVLYQLAEQYYPDDYRLNLHAGFMNFYEKGDFARALHYLRKIESHPSAPPFLISIVNKLRYKLSGDLEIAYQLVRHHYETTTNDSMRNRLRRDLYAIKAEMDLKCLNQHEVSCHRTDLDGVPYFFEKGKFHSARVFLPYDIRKRKRSLEGSSQQ